MDFLSWRDDYGVGVAAIDAEHRYLFGLINEFHDKHARGGETKEVSLVLNRLVAYAQVHFRNEEALLSAKGFPRLEHHQQQHEALFQSIFSLNERLAAGTIGVDQKVMQFLKRWLVDHILKEDMDYADFLRRKSAQGETATQGKPADPGADQAGVNTGTAETEPDKE